MESGSCVSCSSIYAIQTRLKNPGLDHQTDVSLGNIIIDMVTAEHGEDTVSGSPKIIGTGCNCVPEIGDL